MTKSVSLAEAKATLSEKIREVEDGDPIMITRHGRAVAALVRPDELENLMRLRAAGPTAGLASLVGGWPGSDELVREIEATGRMGHRQTPELD
ncbi:MAG TPA: type II toxin-antitoxin system Phd/YefM family antitoxin [Longimicrobium sp.]|nr:type II toxin-antitoxin system Phd/YefM family antitoxin [Longimicrobium sp.]